MKNKWVFLIIVILLIAGLSVLNSGIWKKNDNAKSTKLQIIASFYPLYFFAKEIGKDKADVGNITPAGSEPHDYEPTTQDLAKISKADMLVLNGGNLEAWGGKIKDQLQGTKVLTVIAGDNLANKQLDEYGKKILDPHIWLDPELAKKEVARITAGYISIDPAHASYYQNNERELENQFNQLDEKFVRGLSNCKQKDFVTSHAAFGYLATRYGINQIAISGVSPDEEPSSQKLAEITDLVKKENIKVIFFESLVSPRLAQTIAGETGAKTMVLDPIEGISDDQIKRGKNYFTVMEDNLKNLRSALQCSK